ncbi:type II toxin-antitoxin system Phd/YefM family antitoxin [bacterium]|nr:type II toxin-antitoxin system Phd/YefM family antitoxin [bacterium]
MIQISIDEMKRDLPAYMQRVEAGETLVIIKAGKPVAEIKPVPANSLGDDEFEAVADSLADEFAACVKSPTPVLSEYAVSRASIYEDHP